jgi:hypothetical protein
MDDPNLLVLSLPSDMSANWTRDMIPAWSPPGNGQAYFHFYYHYHFDETVLSLSIHDAITMEEQPFDVLQ